jgi:ribokinase
MKEIPAMSKKRLLVYGDVEMDILLKTDTIDAKDQDVRVENLSFSPGGSAANCATVAGTLGQAVTFLGSVGKDAWAKPLLDDFHRFGIDPRLIQQADGNTGTCVAVVDGRGERKFYSYRGVNESSPPAMPGAQIWKSHRLLHLSGYSFQTPNSQNTAKKLLREAKAHEVQVSLDPAYLFAKKGGAAWQDLFSQLDFFFPNREEAALLSGRDDPLLAAHWFRKMGVGTVLVTLGSEGCILLSERVEKFIKINPIAEVVDTTGAGDAFCGGFLTGWMNGLPLDGSAKLGCAAAAHIITRIGAHDQAPTKVDILSIMRRNHEDELAGLLNCLL